MEALFVVVIYKTVGVTNEIDLSSHIADNTFCHMFIKRTGNKPFVHNIYYHQEAFKDILLHFIIIKCMIMTMGMTMTMAMTNLNVLSINIMMIMIMTMMIIIK